MPELSVRVRNKRTLKEAGPLLDKLSLDWETIEKALASEGILRECHAGYRTYQTHPQEPEVGEYVIGVRKLGGDWRVGYAFLDYRDGELDNWTAIKDAPIAIRIELLDHVALLRERIAKSNEDFVTEIRDALEKSKAVAESLLDAKAKKKYVESRSSLEGN